MPKQMIEIDVPEGSEIDIIARECDSFGRHSYTQIIFKKKEPEFIEVKECLVRLDDGKYKAVTIVKGSPLPAEHMGQDRSFHRWVDTSWRKVYIDAPVKTPKEQRRTPFEKLVERVREINPEAAEWVLRRGDRHCPSKQLSSNFLFSRTPQGEEYWRDIARKLGEMK